MLQQLTNVITLGSLYVMFTLGLTLVFGVAKILNMAHGALFMIGAFGAYVLSQHVVLPLIVLAPITAIGTGALAVVVDLVAFRPLRVRSRKWPQAERAKVTERAMLIASVGVAGVLVAIVTNKTRDEVKHLPGGIYDIETFSLAHGITITNLQVVIFVCMAILSVALAVWVARSRTGRALRALAYDDEASALMGVNGEALIALTMFVSGAMAGLAGLLLALESNAMTSRMGDPLLLKAFAIVILAGAGSIWGTVVGSFALALAETATVVYLNPSLSPAVAFAFIILVLLIKPQGLFPAGRIERA